MPTKGLLVFSDLVIDISAKWAAQFDGGREEIFLSTYSQQDNLIQYFSFFPFAERIIEINESKNLWNKSGISSKVINDTLELLCVSLWCWWQYEQEQ